MGENEQVIIPGVPVIRNELIKAVLPSVVAMIIGAASAYISFTVSVSIMNERLGVLDETVDKIEAWHLKHVDTDGHPVMQERVKTLAERVDKLSP